MTKATPWEPDPRKMGNWAAMFEPARQTGQPPGPTPTQAFDDAALDDGSEPGPAEYRPWILQRGRSRPAMMLHLRRFELRSGLWQGWALSYPSLNAVEYVGARIVSLDFGTRQFIVEGMGLDELVDRLQLGVVTVIQEYASTVWPDRRDESVVTAIRRAGPANGQGHPTA